MPAFFESMQAAVVRKPGLARPFGEIGPEAELASRFAVGRRVNVRFVTFPSGGFPGMASITAIQLRRDGDVHWFRAVDAGDADPRLAVPARWRHAAAEPHDFAAP